jgi:hypothetical protein
MDLHREIIPAFLRSQSLVVVVMVALQLVAVLLSVWQPLFL